MSGGTMFEHPPPAPEWAHAVRRDERNEPPLLSPTYSQVSHEASPYNMPISSVPTAGYPFAGTSTHSRYTHQPQYNSSGEYDVFQTPTPARRTGYEFQPQPVVYEGHVHAHPHGAPMMSASGRSYDSTIPQYYPVMAERSWGPTPEKTASKRKGKGKATPAGAGTGAGGVGTPTPAAKQRGGKRAQATPDEADRASKRARRDEMQVQTASLSVSASTSIVLPTPPPTDGGTYSAQSVAYAELASPQEDAAGGSGESSRRSGIRVMQSEAEGRKLAVGQEGDGELSPVEDKPARMTPVPSLNLGENGQATIGTEQILQSDLAWMENGGARPFSIPSIPESPAQNEEKMERRLLAFTATPRSEEPMVCTRIDSMGRVAVRKDVAARFLGLESSSRLIEEMSKDDEDDWVDAMAGTSRVPVKPLWPDDQAPWSVGVGIRRDRRSREDREKAALLRRYLETSPDEASDEEVVAPRTHHPKGKGKSVSRLVSFSLPQADPRQRQALDNTSADAKAALMTVIRHRQLPPIPPAVIACACGGGPVPGRQSMVMCCQCKSYHHCLCTGQQEGVVDWWCPPCQHDLIRPSTPPRQSIRGYNQSDERSSAFKGQVDLALAPSPMFASASAFPGTSLRTPLGRVVASPSSRNHRSRILSFGNEMWPYNEEAAPAPAPTTPAPDARFTTPRIDDVPFDVTSTPSRHIDFNFGGAPLFSLTPLGGRGRNVSALMADTPLAFRGRVPSGVNPEGAGMTGRHDFLRDLAGPSGAPGTSAAAAASAAAGLAELASPRSATRSHFLGLSPSPFGHKRSVSGNKFSAMRNSAARSGLGLGMPAALDERVDEQDEEDEGDGDEREEGRGGREGESSRAGRGGEAGAEPEDELDEDSS